MRNQQQYVSYKDYEHWSIESVASDLTKSGKSLPIREGFREQNKKKKKRGMGYDCLFIPPYEDYDVKKMLEERKEVGCQMYDPEWPYLYQFTPLFAKYPFGQEYENIGGDTNHYLDIFPPSYIDDHAKVEYSYEEK